MTFRQEASADFAGAARRLDRSLPAELEYLKHLEETGEFPPQVAEWFAPAFVEGQLRMAGFDLQPGPTCK